MEVREYFVSEKKVKLTAYIQSYSNDINIAACRPAVLILAGGGYEFVSHREGEPVALSYLAQGFQAFTLSYTVLNDGIFPNPQLQAFDAIRFIRQHALEFNIDKDRLAVVGFSAGGHLAASTAVHYKTPLILDKLKASREELRPNAAVLVYPCITSEQYAYPGIKTVHGKGLDGESLKLLNLVDYVDNNTPPSYICHTADDSAVPSLNSILYAAKLSEYNVAYELHIFKSGSHGMTLANKATQPNPEIFSDQIRAYISDPKVLNAIRESMLKFKVWFNESVEFLYSCFNM